MFPETWRRRWGLQEAPFLHDDADRDPLLERVDRWAVHAAFERLHRGAGPGPSALVFGLRGSGKSALRRRLGEAMRGPHGPLVVELTELDPWLEQLERTQRPDSRGPGEVEGLDLLLSATARVLTEQLAAAPARLRSLPRRTRVQLLGLLALYTPDLEGQRARQLERLLHPRRERIARAGAASLAGIAALSPLAALQGLVPSSALLPALSAMGGCALTGLALLPPLLRRALRGRARRLASEVGVVSADVSRLAVALARLLPSRRFDRAADPLERRLERVRLVIAALRGLGWSGLQVLVDRVDESRALDGDPLRMRALLEPLVTGRLSEQEGISVQAFLPLELRPMARPRAGRGLLHSSFEKRGCVEELRWSGQQLLELADRRLSAAARGPAPKATDLLGPAIHPAELRDTLDVLGTPRLAFGFLGELFEVHLRELPTELETSSPRWGVPRSTFETCRAAWSDRAASLRRGRVLERTPS
jgi:hypothetical protein